MKQIYKITNNINNKIYIGQHNGKRSSYFGSGKILKNAFNKYGRENFTKEILTEGEFDQSELDLLEQFYIKLYNSNNSKIGYNITLGGLGWMGSKLSNEVRKKMSESRRGKKRNPLSEEHKYKLRLAKLGKKQSKELILKRSISISKSLMGKKLSKEHIESLRISHLGYKMPEKQKENMSKSHINNPKLSKIIKCYNINGDFVKEYPSISQAYRETGIYAGNICACLRGKVNSSGKYKWEYK